MASNLRSFSAKVSKIYGKSLFKSFHNTTLLNVRASFIWNRSLTIFQALVETVFKTRNIGHFSSTKSSHRRCSIKKVFLQNPQNSQESTCGLQLNRGSGTGVFL